MIAQVPVCREPPTLLDTRTLPLRVRLASTKSANRNVLEQQPSMEPRAFHIVELFEAILDAANFYDLIRCTRVCRHWRNKILASPVLRHKLFLANAPKDTPREINPLFDCLLHESWSEYSRIGKTSAPASPWKDMMVVTLQTATSTLTVTYLHHLARPWDLTCFIDCSQGGTDHTHTFSAAHCSITLGGVFWYAQRELQGNMCLFEPGIDKIGFSHCYKIGDGSVGQS